MERIIKALVFLLLGLSTNGFSQITRSVSFSTNFITPASYEGYSSSNYIRESYIIDSLWLQETVLRERFYTTHYRHVGAATLSFKFSKAVANNLYVNTGIGMDYAHIDVQRNVIGTETISNPINFTAAPPVPSNFQFLYDSPCDFYTNSWQDVTLEPGYEIRNYSILLPLEIEYFYKTTGLSVALGLYLSSPVASHKLDDRYGTHKREQGGDVYCTWFREETVNRSGRDVRNDQVGGNARLQYTLKNGLAMNAGYMRNFNNFYIDRFEQSNNNSGVLAGNEHSFTMHRFTLGFSYYFKRRLMLEREIPRELDVIN